MTESSKLRHEGKRAEEDRLQREKEEEEQMRRGKDEERFQQEEEEEQFRRAKAERGLRKVEEQLRVRQEKEEEERMRRWKDEERFRQEEEEERFRRVKAEKGLRKVEEQLRVWQEKEEGERMQRGKDAERFQQEEEEERFRRAKPEKGLRKVEEQLQVRREREESQRLRQEKHTWQILQRARDGDVSRSVIPETSSDMARHRERVKNMIAGIKRRAKLLKRAVEHPDDEPQHLLLEDKLEERMTTFLDLYHQDGNRSKWSKRRRSPSPRREKQALQAEEAKLARQRGQAARLADDIWDQGELNTPLARHITLSRGTRRNLPTNLGTYNGSTNPNRHVSQFEAQIFPYQFTDEMKCLTFPTTLMGHAHAWFTKLKPRSINNFTQLTMEFCYHFQLHKDKEKDKMTILSVKQSMGEALKSWWTHFYNEVNMLRHIDIGSIVSAIKWTSSDKDLIKSVTAAPPKDMLELRDRVSFHISIEELMVVKGQMESFHIPKAVAPQEKKQRLAGVFEASEKRDTKPTYVRDGVRAATGKWCVIHKRDSHDTDKCLLVLKAQKLKEEADQNIAHDRMTEGAAGKRDYWRKKKPYTYYRNPPPLPTNHEQMNQSK